MKIVKFNLYRDCVLGNETNDIEGIMPVSNIFSDICSIPIVSLNYNYDLSKLRYKLFTYESNNLVYYVNLCSNYTSPCLPQDSVCMTPKDNVHNVSDLAYSSTLDISSNGVEGLTFYYSGGQCFSSRYNTTIIMICNDGGNSQIVDILVNGCQTKIIIESEYACGSYIDPSSSSGCIYSIGKMFTRCCRDRNESNNYQPISEASSSSHTEKIQHEYTDGKLSQQGELCTICCENKVNTVLLNCGHAVLCVECTEKLTKCPLYSKSKELDNNHSMDDNLLLLCFPPEAFKTLFPMCFASLTNLKYNYTSTL
ncbi:hypothetical protein PPL_03558 [Heterostelium album PN500]|uniref:RING-type domain-containing protein n=1 Tax=Heterostelium pallidum (strain ATCC 26659 / Pp 5 / PN500) TaxID=670386 RepID=D3B547_HETP5|nr:hypothetical protein PPL_03558 [Heterostelium album PN500]EFA83412.1 hypothetical protein PPL_03558 [Heterostelium album PN500]|eukprot:XP_020435529.1 hypothetical protein PPL_03558 [Heterostelium album PN500]